jgi:hypothetical protein
LHLLEAVRLDLLAPFRALEHLAPEQIPQRLSRQPFELDADLGIAACPAGRVFQAVD